MWGGGERNLLLYGRRYVGNYLAILLCFNPSLSAEPAIPGNVQAMRSSEDSTIITVTWEPLTLVEARGFIQYLVMLRAFESSKGQVLLGLLSMQVPSNRGSATFTNLDPAQGYEASVAAVTSNGTVGASEYTID